MCYDYVEEYYRFLYMADNILIKEKGGNMSKKVSIVMSVSNKEMRNLDYDTYNQLRVYLEPHKIVDYVDTKLEVE